MNITVFTSTTPLSFYKDANKEYEKRLSRFCKLHTHIVHCDDDLLACISKDLFVIDINKKYNTITSECLSNTISTLAISSNSNIAIILVDFKHSLKPHLNLAISKSFLGYSVTHTLLLEQIYRSFKIINNESYHK